MFWYLRLLLSYNRSPLLNMLATMLVDKSRQERANLKGQARRVVSKKKMSVEIRSLVLLPFAPAGSPSPLPIGNKTNPRNRSGTQIGYVVLERTIVLLIRNSRRLGDRYYTWRRRRKIDGSWCWSFTFSRNHDYLMTCMQVDSARMQSGLSSKPPCFSSFFQEVSSDH
jgi:hypothetical protein